MKFSLPLLLELASANDGLHLLQMHAHTHLAETKPKGPIPPNPNQPTYELKKRHPKFGPDGTWATPYCKSLLGCNPYCVDGCNGVAYWEASRAPPGLGAEGREAYDPNHPGAHFISCIQGDTTRGRPPTPDYNVKTMGGNVQCTGSENSTKKPFWHKSIMTTARKDELKIAWGCNDDGVCKSWNSGGWIGDGHGWGNEYCPKGCVNDCAEFKMGGFLSCGYAPHGGESGWYGYDGARNNANGPNARCPQNIVSGTGHQAWTWCGEPKAEKEPVPDDFSCDLCEDSDNDFDPEGKKGKCKKISEKAQKSPQACEKRKKRSGVQKRCCPDPPVECPLCPDGKEFQPDGLDGKCAKIAERATKNQEICDKMKLRKKPQRKCCVDPAEATEAAAKPVLGEPLVGNGIWGGTNCGHREQQYGGEIAYTSACTRMIICEAKESCVAKGITSPETCMAKVVEEKDKCEMDYFEWRTTLFSHCFCNPKGRTWVPYTQYAPSRVYPMK